MENTLFRGAKLDDSQMEGVEACKADFSDCSLRGANLTSARLDGASLKEAVLENVVGLPEHLAAAA
jgi:uncharacterized protein YjbI with pentapeptide repeats